MMNREEARMIYGLVSAIYLDWEDIVSACEKKGVPKELVLEFRDEDKKFDKFLEMHDDDGNFVG
jgi:hypothetical protein